ncbi:MAG: hypothetical protein ACLVAK_07975 [Clostridia bacterium]
MNLYEKSTKEFKRKLKENKALTYDEWNKYAHENMYFSAFTLMCHKNAHNFKHLERKMLLSW